MCHYWGNNVAAGKAFEYLAEGEHIRWVASHEMNGYVKAEPGKTDDLLRCHDCLIPYAQLNELDDIEEKGQYKHYDWIVVKSSLI